MENIVRELYREGSFEARHVVDVSNRCGIGEGPLVFRYCVRLAARNTNARGFILDNRATNLYFCEKWGSDEPKALPSCEEIAEIAMQDFRDLCALEGVELTGAEVLLYGGTYSCVTVRWGDITPSVPHPAMGVPTPAPQVEAIPSDDPVLANLARVVHRAELALAA